MKVKKQIESLDEITLDLIESGKLKESNLESNNHYVNNKELYNEFLEYEKLKLYNESMDLPKPRMPEKIGRAIIQIATRRCNSRQFVGYSNNWKEEMIGNAIMTATIRCKFDPEKSNNPFGYLTQICNNAIIEELKREKRRLYVRYKAIEEANGFIGEVDDNLVEEEFHHQMEGVPSDLRREYIDEFERSNFKKSKESDLDDIEDDSGIMQFI